MTDRDVVLLRERHDLLEQFGGRERAGGVVGVVEPEHLRLARDVLRYL